MKAHYLLSILFVAIAIATSAQTISKEKTAVMLENESKYGFTATVDSLSKTILAGGWKILTTHNLQEALKKNGKEVLPVKVMEICNPGLAYQILSKDDLKDASPMLPCRITVYEKTDGKTYISRMNAPMLAGMLDADAAKTVNQAFGEVEGFLKTVVN
jgi:uncharacterized protein (DUF302 family)